MQTWDIFNSGTFAFELTSLSYHISQIYSDYIRFLDIH
jgi:hypothetical protein